MDLQDQIERELYIQAPVERVWHVLTERAHLERWFGTLAELDLRPGGKALFGFHAERYDAVVEKVEAPHRFAWRWSLKDGVAMSASPTALVTFELSSEQESTRVRMVETGFATLTEEDHKFHLHEHDTEWDPELAELVEYAEAQA